MEKERGFGSREMSCTGCWSLLSPGPPGTWQCPGAAAKGLHCSSWRPRERVSAVPPSTSWWDPGLSVPGRNLEGFYYPGRWCDLYPQLNAHRHPPPVATAGPLAGPTPSYQAVLARRLLGS